MNIISQEDLLQVVFNFHAEQIHISKVMIDICKDVASALFLSTLAWHTFNNENVINNDSWFYHGSKQWAALGISKDTRLRIQRQLQEQNLIEVKIMGMPARNHYRLNVTELSKRIINTSKESSQLSGKPTTSCRESRQQAVGKADNNTIYKIKKENREEMNSSISPTLDLKSIDKTGSFLPSAKLLEKTLNISSYKAKELEKELKNIESISDRKTYLIELLHNKNYKYDKKLAVTNEVQEENKVLDKKESNRLEDIRLMYESTLGVKIPLTQENINDYYNTRTKYKYSEITYVVRNILRASSRGEKFYSVNFNTVLKEKTINRLISDPFLASLEKEV